MFTRLTVAALAVLLGSTSAAIARGDEGAKKLRVGVYDNRAIAIAYAPSKYNPVAAKMKEYREAEEAGDAEKMKELKSWGETHQRQLHRQGFGRVPVEDLLAHVKDKIPEVAKKARVDVIVFECTYAAENVEVVDVTMELAALFEPSEKTLKILQDLKDNPPVDLDTIEKHGHDH
jgi:hypothetical protein